MKQPTVECVLGIFCGVMFTLMVLGPFFYSAQAPTESTTANPTLLEASGCRNLQGIGILCVRAYSSGWHVTIKKAIGAGTGVLYDTHETFIPAKILPKQSLENSK